ncbi:MAG TPA: N-6 DNA methylase [Steroidobacteraceae bacterium]|jgi:hypothetical protein|nr:N-6 DNA methylase [Steroidobacteraceae bacterium]
MNLAEAIDKLHERLQTACTPQKQKRSENHWTAHTWQVFFEDLNCRAILDSSGNSANDRPDVQVWCASESPHGPELWIEARSPGTFSSKTGINRLLGELLRKLDACLQSNEPVPDEILITDFFSHYLWPVDRFLRIIESGRTPERPLGHLGAPVALWRTIEGHSFKADLRETFARWSSLSDFKSEHQSRLDLDSLIRALLSLSADFRKGYLHDAVAMVGNDSAVRRLFGEWMAAGGELAVSMVAPEAGKRNVAAEEAFVELCFHSVVVRCFMIKWFLDHGHLASTDCARDWGLLNSRSPTSLIRKAICPSGSTAAERLIGQVFRSTNVYLWILEAAPASLWIKMKQAFARYTLVAERSDILGEFYQRYMHLFAKQAQLLLGQFYTPHVLTRAMWKLVGEVLRKRGISLQDESCLVIDPSVGTGTFLTQGLRLLLDGAWGTTNRLYAGQELAAIASRFTGFEVNPLSRGVAVVNCLTELLAHSSDGCQSFAGKIRVFETNAYDVPERRQPDLIPLRKAKGTKDEDFLAWKKDMAAATQAKQKEQYRVVVGNPPWRNPSPACKNKRVQDVLKNEVMPWAWEYRGQKLSSIKGCIHGVREDYAFFMGLAVRLLQERGLLAYVTNESWLTAPTYTLLRKYLLDHFQIHAVLRIGPYFEGVKERAAVVVAEKVASESAGRDQEIRYLDWSDLSNSNWSRSWINGKLETLIQGDLGRNAWSKIHAVGSDCRIRERSSCSYSNDLPSCIGIEEIFKVVNSGAQAGCGPIFLNVDKTTLEKRMRMLFRGDHDELVEQISDEVRGGRPKAVQLVRERFQAIAKTGAMYDPRAVRSILAHFPNHGDPKKRGYCYFDSQIWLFPRTERVSPEVRTIWDSKPKLIFRDMYDPCDKRIIGAVEMDGCVIDNHLFNGGVYVAVPKTDAGASNLTDLGNLLREKFTSDTEFLNYLSAVLNSSQVQEWGKSNPLERVKIPTGIDAKLACRMAKIEQAKSPPWAPISEPELARKRQAERIADLFETVIEALEEAA